MKRHGGHEYIRSLAPCPVHSGPGPPTDLGHQCRSVVIAAANAESVRTFQTRCCDRRLCRSAGASVVVGELTVVGPPLSGAHALAIGDPVVSRAGALHVVVGAVVSGPGDALATTLGDGGLVARRSPVVWRRRRTRRLLHWIAAVE